MVCLKRLITPGLPSLEAFGFVRASLYIYIGASIDAPINDHIRIPYNASCQQQIVVVPLFVTACWTEKD